MLYNCVLSVYRPITGSTSTFANHISFRMLWQGSETPARKPSVKQVRRQKQVFSMLNLTIIPDKNVHLNKLFEKKLSTQLPTQLKTETLH